MPAITRILALLVAGLILHAPTVMAEGEDDAAPAEALKADVDGDQPAAPSESAPAEESEALPPSPSDTPAPSADSEDAVKELPPAPQDASPVEGQVPPAADMDTAPPAAAMDTAPPAAAKDNTAPPAAAKDTAPPKADEAPKQAPPPPREIKDTSVKTFLRGLRPDFGSELGASAWSVG